jgi:hypothetical protein
MSYVPVLIALAVVMVSYLVSKFFGLDKLLIHRHDCLVQHQIAVGELDIYGYVMSESVDDHIKICQKYYLSEGSDGYAIRLHSELNKVLSPPKALPSRRRPQPTLPDPSRRPERTSSTSGLRRGGMTQIPSRRCLHPSWTLVAQTLSGDADYMCNHCSLTTRLTWPMRMERGLT